MNRTERRSASFSVQAFQWISNHNIFPSTPIFLILKSSFNDVSFHGSTQVPTPNIDAIANNGVKLMNYHVRTIPHTCTHNSHMLRFFSFFFFFLSPIARAHRTVPYMLHIQQATQMASYSSILGVTNCIRAFRMLLTCGSSYLLVCFAFTIFFCSFFFILPSTIILILIGPASVFSNASNFHVWKVRRTLYSNIFINPAG